MHTPSDPALSRAYGQKTISRTQYEKCDRDLLELHFFLFKLLRDSYVGKEWIFCEDWNEFGYEPIRPEDYDSGSDAESARGDEVIDRQCERMRKQDRDVARYNKNHGKETPEDHLFALSEKMREWEDADNDVTVPKNGDLLARLEKEYNALEKLVADEDAEAKVKADAEEEVLKEQDRAGKWE